MQTSGGSLPEYFRTKQCTLYADYALPINGVFRCDPPAASFDVGDRCVAYAKNLSKLNLSKPLGRAVCFKWVGHHATQSSTQNKATSSGPRGIFFD